MSEWKKIIPGRQYHGDLLLYNAAAAEDEINMVLGHQACNSGNRFYGFGMSGEPFNATHLMRAPEPPTNEKAKPKSGIGSKFDDFLKEEGIYDSVLKALMAIVPDEDGDGWWCPECRAHISCVTNDESCTMCGTYLADVQPSEKWLKDARYAIAAAQECKKRRHERK